MFDERTMIVHESDMTYFSKMERCALLINQLLILQNFAAATYRKLIALHIFEFW